jgi:hypothetical protein
MLDNVTFRPAIGDLQALSACKLHRGDNEGYSQWRTMMHSRTQVDKLTQRNPGQESGDNIFPKSILQTVRYKITYLYSGM